MIYSINYTSIIFSLLCNLMFYPSLTKSKHIPPIEKCKYKGDRGKKDSIVQKHTLGESGCFASISYVTISPLGAVGSGHLKLIVGCASGASSVATVTLAISTISALGRGSVRAEVMARWLQRRMPVSRFMSWHAITC